MKKDSIINYYHNISIKTKLIIAVLVLILYPLVILGFMGYLKYAQVIKSKSIDYANKDVEYLTKVLADRAKSIEEFSLEIIRDEKIVETNNSLIKRINNKEDTWEEQRDFQKYLRTVLNSRPEIDTVLFRFSQKKELTCFERKDYSDLTNKFEIADKAYEQTKNSKGQPVWYFFERSNDGLFIYMARMVYDRYSQKEIGVFVFRVDGTSYFLKTVNEYYKDYLEQIVQNISILNKDNLELYSTNAYGIDYQKALFEIIGTELPDAQKRVQLQAGQAYMIYKKVNVLGWKLVVSISTDKILEDVRSVLRTMILLCLVTLPIYIVLINYFYIDIIKPMGVLIDNMRKIEEGDTTARVDTIRNDELGFVFKTFNAMSQEINNLINSVYKEQLAMKDAEIKALQAQINPHFLYNTLETINWKARLYGVEEISDMVTAFSSIIEANLNRKNEKIIPLYKEVEYIDNYNLLIQMRFGKKIKFKKEVQEEALNYEIPKLLIQPLIENAIYHGLETKKGGGTIELIITVEEGTLLIIVSDDGTGIEDEKLKNIKKELAESKNSRVVDNSKIGIMNVHRRIRLLYGDEYGLKIFSEVGKGTTIIINLPFTEHRGEDVNDESPID
ncbi:MAG: sensor histidine kinase [Clostridia bacterium]|nr:sensor histidine kinase [Clostridia bacterium]